MTTTLTRIINSSKTKNHTFTNEALKYRMIISDILSFIITSRYTFLYGLVVMFLENFQGGRGQSSMILPSEVCKFTMQFVSLKRCGE